MANLIQIKRSLTTATAPSLANGELAFTANGDHLFIGSNGASITIAGKFNPGVLTANQALVANGTSGIDRIITANAIVTTLTANGSTGTAGQVLNSNGTVAYWANPASSSFTIAGETGTDTFNTGETLTFAAANGISTAVTDGTVTFGVDTGSTLTVNSTGMHVNSALSITDLTLSGNLTVSGTLTTIDTNNLVVEDPLIKLANGNATTDSLDVGFYGVYGSTGAKYTGLFRDATDGIYNLYTGSQEEPTTTVNTAATGYGLATLRTYLTSGGLVANSTAVTITANSTYNVNLTANTIKLSTLTAGGILVGNSTNGMTNLAVGTDGYVLQSNGTSVVYGTLDGGTF